jgi:hypothetical protein
MLNIRAEMHVHLHIKWLLLSPDFNQIRNAGNIFVELHSVAALSAEVACQAALLQ